MKTWFLTVFLIVLNINYNYAQKVSLKKWASHTIDSLQKNQVDTIEYYHAYCGECEILRKPTDTLLTHQCEVENSWTQIVNEIIYKQKDKYYSLTFNCGYPPIKKELKSANSLKYFLSIVPVLNKRDKHEAAMRKKRKFNPPIIVDGGYEEAFLYCSHIKQHVFMQDDQKTDKGWRFYFWIDKQTQLLALLESETSSKN
ncbi:MAG TPA: hypothetical protein VIM16_04525 [Mucilaginibacter sp.]|jgi:hypothetical protein